MKSVKDLVIVKDANPAIVFTEQGSGELLALITNEVRSFVLDVNTNQGRKDITSLAYKVSQSKTYLDDLGKDLVAEWKQKVSAVDSVRKKIREHMDGLRDEIKKPLEEWEVKEKQRVESLQQKIGLIFILSRPMDSNGMFLSSVQLTDNLRSLNKIEINDSWQEFKTEASIALEKANNDLTQHIRSRIAYEDQQAELIRLRKMKEENDAKERLELENRKRLETEELNRKNREENEKKILVKQKEDAEKRARDAELKFEEEKRQQKVREEIAIRKQKEEQERAENQRIYEEDKRKKEAEEHKRLEEEKRVREEFNKKLEEELIVKRAQEYEQRVLKLSEQLQELMDRNASTIDLAKWILEGFVEL